MTQQEQQLLNGLIERVNGTEVANKDYEAENLLRNGLGNKPDALYILCQTVLVQQFAMDNAQRQLTAARAELDQLRQQQTDKPQEHGSFLGNLFGLGKNDDKPSQEPAPTYGNTGSQPTGYQPVHNPSAPPYGSQQPGYSYGQNQPGYPQQPPPGYPGGYAQPGYGGAPMGGGMFGSGGGFLQGAMQTAAGVVAGEFAFRAIEDVFHGFGGGGGRGFEGGNTEVVNNYYGDDNSARDGDSFGDRLASADGYNGGISSDIEDRRGDSQGFLGGNDGDDRSAFADSGDSGNDSFSDDSFSDDSSSDDGGGDFSGGNDDSGF